MVEITIAICTYKRVEIKETLYSISKQKLPSEISFQVIVADNDINSDAKIYIEGIAKKFNLILNYVHAPSRNISIARNACITHCKTDWLVFLDDDETASDAWLAEMVKTAQFETADVVFGPVTSVYLQETPQWIKDCDFHSTQPVFVNGIIETGYTGNTLLNLTSPYLTGYLFDLKLGRSGGEDTDFLSKAYKRGAKLSFSPQAEVFEAVPESRASLTWLAKRKFRVGQSYASTLITPLDGFLSLFIKTIKTSGKLLICMLMAIISIFSANKKYSWFLRGCLHFGVIAKFLGKQDIEQY